MDELETGKEYVIADPILVNGELAFSEGERAVVESIDPSKERPESKYIVYSAKLHKRFRLSEGNLKTSPINSLPSAPQGPRTPPQATSKRQPAPVPPKRRSSMILGSIVGIIGMGIAVIGSFTPWISASLGAHTVSGWEKQGRITLVFSLIALVFFFIGLIVKASWPFIVAVIGSAGVMTIMILNAIDIWKTFSFSNVGPGLLAGMGGGLLGLIAAMLTLSPQRE